MIEVVPFAAEHGAAVIDVILSIQQAEFAIPITLQDQPDLHDIPGFYRRGAGNFWVALSGGRVIGTIALLDIGNAQGALRKMFVRADFRGRDRGVAPRLLGTLLDWCAAKQMREIFLGTTSAFVAAHRFYEKNGFTEIAQAALPPAFPVMSVDTRFYRLRVAGGDDGCVERP